MPRKPSRGAEFAPAVPVRAAAPAGARHPGSEARVADGGDGRGSPPAWERVRSEQVGDFEIFRVRRDRARSPRDGQEHDFNIAESEDGVTVVALTPDGGIVLVEQFRHPFRRVETELPAGVVDPGEEPAAAAARELREETGFEGADPEIIGCIVLNPSWQLSRVHVAVVRDARRTASKDEDPAEDVRVHVASAGDVRRMVTEGRITSSVAISALALHAWKGGDGAGG